MSNHFEENAKSWGADGATWLESIPEIVQDYERRWSITALHPFPLSYNYVAPVERADGSPAVLKIGFPRDREFKTEVAALKTFRGEGCVALLETDTTNTAMLIERVEPGIPLSTVDDDEKATRIIASVIKKLHKPLPANHNFITVDEWAQAIPEYQRKYPGDSGPLPAKLVDNARRIFKELIATSDTPVLLHGDLHHDNILRSSAKGWMAIDPKGVAAEPAYEVAAMIRNPYEKLKTVDNLKSLLARRIAILAEELEFDPMRLQQWCLAQTVLSAVWSVDGGAKSYEHALRVAQVLADL